VGAQTPPPGHAAGGRLTPVEKSAFSSKSIQVDITLGLLAMVGNDRLAEIWLKTKSLTSGRRGGEILFHPHFPGRFNYTIVKICNRLGLRKTFHRTGKTILAIHWEDVSVSTPMPEVEGVRILNNACLDITKRRIEAEFETVFRYPLAIDPTVPCNRIVRKSNLNAKHDGVVIDTPVQPDPDYVYEILVDNRVNERLVEDIRVPVVGRQIPLVYLKYRPVETRFANENSSAEIAKPEDYLSVSEIGLIKKLAEAMGADFCEIDVLRDRQSGRIYIVDLNTTPFGPPLRLDFFNRMRAVDLLALAFESEFLPKI
jgi:hypothetical protein